MEKFSEWLSDEGDRHQISCNELQTLYYEIAARIVSIKGKGVFSLRNSVFANVRLYGAKFLHLKLCLQFIQVNGFYMFCNLHISR